MKHKEDLSESLKKDQKITRSGFPHSKAYHRFFSGYSEYYAPRSNGIGFTIHRLYTGDYYSQDLTPKQKFWLRIRLVLTYLFAVMLFSWSSTRLLRLNTVSYMVFAQAASLFFLSWIFIALVAYLSAGEKMTIAEYQSSSRGLIKANLGASISLGAGGLAAVFRVLTNPWELTVSFIFYALGFFLAGLACLANYLMERKVPYLETPSDNTPPEDSVEIH